MIPVPIPANDEQRLIDLYSYDILDSEPEQDFTDIVELASYICNTPISLISLVDGNRQWFKAKVGTTEVEVDRQTAICGYTILSDAPFIVTDASADQRFAHFASVNCEPGVRFYAGFPLVTPQGNSIGSLCVIDTKARRLDGHQLKALNTLSNQVVKLVEERSNARKFRERARLEKIQNISLEQLMQTQRRIMTILGHDARAPLYAIDQMLKLTGRGKITGQELQANIELISNQLGATLVMIEDLLSWGKNHLRPREEFDKQRFFVHNIVADVLSVLTTNAQLKNLELINKVERGIESPVPATMMSFIIRNLLNNAIKFTDHGSVGIEAVEETEVPGDAGALVIRITDTGRGMSEKQLRFMNRKPNEPQPDDFCQDSGIGIMMIQEFLQQLGGSIRFDAGVDGGTVVSIRLQRETQAPEAKGAIIRKFAL